VEHLRSGGSEGAALRGRALRDLLSSRGQGRENQQGDTDVPEESKKF